MRFVICAVLIFVASSLSAQINEYNLKSPEPRETGKICNDFLTRINSMPADVTMGFYEEKGQIFWGITDDTWLAQIFKDKKDGVAVDIISKSQFPCGQKNILANSKIYKGELLKPVYLKDFKNTILTNNLGMAGFRIGDLPEKYKDEEYELNMILIHDGYVCDYNSFFDVPRARWDLLEMPMFIDSAKASSLSDTGKAITIVKNLQFVIPFKKNKFDYSENDIKPIYDSLKLSNYTIRSITINAYASVEGPTDNNIRLQNNRAEAIAKALEKVQNKSAIKKITAEENWVEFLDDIDSTQFPEVYALSRSEIKKKLENNELSEKLEPILSKHRKAVVRLELESRSTYMDADASALAREFKSGIEKKDASEALAIQDAVFTRISQGELNKEVLDTIKIPDEKPFLFLLNNKTAFGIKDSLPELKIKLEQFQSLKKRYPEHKSLDYNITVLKIRIWAKGEQPDPALLRKEIKDLSTKKVSPFLTRRLFINYHILLSELLISQRKYEAKNQALKFIYDNYKSLALKDRDLLQLAKYFSGYSRLDWAEKVLVNRVKSIEADEDLIFYYLNLTIIEPKNVKKAAYRTILNNAATKNPKRFCKMFDPYGKGGINFQLLADDYLKKMYCEMCK